MKVRESEGFFCVVYFSDTKKTAYYHKVYTPSKLAATLANWLWIKVFVDKQDYYSNTKTTSYHCIFDKNNPVTEFSYRPFLKKS
jgi:hypothetical protein